MPPQAPASPAKRWPRRWPASGCRNPGWRTSPPPARTTKTNRPPTPGSSQALADYRRRHHRASPDILGPRPPGAAGQEWDHLTDALAPELASSTGWSRCASAPSRPEPTSPRRPHRHHRAPHRAANGPVPGAAPADRHGPARRGLPPAGQRRTSLSFAILDGGLVLAVLLVGVGIPAPLHWTPGLSPIHVLSLSRMT